MSGADVVVQCLYNAGVRVIFGMPGSHTVALYDAIHRHGGLRTVLIRNEQAGAFAADGYARATGLPSVICTTAGPGATNALTGIAEAWADSVPVLLLTGQVNHDRMYQECGNYHEIDLEGIFRPCTKYVATVQDNAEIPTLVRDAFHAMTKGRPRPAALILPQDLMADKCAPQPEFVREAKTDQHTNAAEWQSAIRAAAQMLSEARRPLLLAGGGAVSANSATILPQLAERLNCPIITTQNGKGILDERDPLSLGHARSAKGRIAQQHADAMLAIGCRFMRS